MGRNHVSTACIVCRGRKVRCDGNRPNCGRCEKKSVMCRYIPGEDKRKLSSRNSVCLLFRRVNRLTQILHDHEIGIPPLEPDTHRAFDRLLEAMHLPSGTLTDFKDSAGHQSEQPAGSSEMQDDGSDLPGIARSNMALEAVGCLSAMTNEVHREARQLEPIFDASSILHPLHSGESQALWSGDSPNWPWPSMDTLPISPSWLVDFTADTPLSSFTTSMEAMVTTSSDSQHNRPSFQADRPEDEEAPDEVVEDLSAHLGGMQVASDGQLRYYGATSSFHLQGRTQIGTQYLPPPGSRCERQEILDRAEVGQEVPRDIKDHLIKLYFMWENSNIRVVQRNIFESARSAWGNGENNSNYSEVLLNAMCALGASFESRYHPLLVTYPKTLADFFGQKAKVLLETELDSPTVAIAQALAILSQHEKACMRDARGWLYSGMAMRVALDLGLHLDQSASVRLGKMSTSDAESRRVAFWGIFITNNLWSFYLGRDFQLGNADVTVSKPDSNIGMPTADTWETNVTQGDEHAVQTLQPELFHYISRQWVNLCDMVAPIAHALYGSSKMDREAIQRLSEEVTATLWAWEKDVNSKLRVDLEDRNASYASQTLILHMQFHQFLILIHRPWTSKTLLQPSPPQGPGYQHARTVCKDSAIKIAKLLRMHEERYTLRYLSIQAVHILYSAVPILIFATISKTNVDEDLGLHLGTCHRALDILGQGFDHAKQIQKLLVALEQRWEALVR